MAQATLLQLEGEVSDCFRKLEKAKEKLLGPVEGWCLEDYRAATVSLETAVWEIYKLKIERASALRGQILSKPIPKSKKWFDDLDLTFIMEYLAGLDAVHAERLQQADNFYLEMLPDYSTIGSLVAALRRREVLELTVRNYAEIAYLPKVMREAMASGYRITPLSPPGLIVLAPPLDLAMP